ncbi:MAG: response regulator [Anaerolineae bacterium]|nr:response regulator [Anaerolineae bacterium]
MVESPDAHCAPILIIDDQQEQLAVFKLMLRRIPCPLLTAQSADQALQVLQDNIPAIIILDIAMPGMNGIDLLRTIRQDERLNGTRVIIATAVANLVPRPVARLADRILTKPLSLQDINSAVRELLKLES